MGRLRIEATLIKYIDYSTGYAIKAKQTHPSWSNQDGWTNDKMQNADPTPIAIPPYQRKLVWKGNDIEKLFKSLRINFGNKFNNRTNHILCFLNLINRVEPSNPNSYRIVCGILVQSQCQQDM